MPEKQTLQRARQAKRTGKKATTQASEFVREEMHHMKEGKHGPESRAQAIAIGLSKARQAGVDLKPPAAGQAKGKTRQSARSAYRRGQEEGELSDKKTASPRRRSTTARKTARKSTTARKSAPARKRTTTRGAKTGGRTAAAGRTSRAKTASKRGTPRKGTSTARSRSSSRAKK